MCTNFVVFVQVKNEIIGICVLFFNFFIQVENEIVNMCTNFIVFL